MANYWERREARWERAGEAIGSMLKDRWDTKEAEEFMANEFQMFKGATTEFRNSVSAIEDGDQLGGAFLEWKNQTLMPFITNATASYANNPRIMQMVQQVVEANNNGLDEYIKIEQYGHERGQREEKETAAKQESEARLGLVGAQTEQAKATAGLRRAQAGAVGAEKEQKTWPQVQPGTTLTEARTKAQNLKVNFPTQAQDIVQRAEAMHMSQMVSARRGQDKPDGTKWGDDATKDLADVGIEWAASPRRAKAAEAALLKSMNFDVAAHDYYADVLAGELPEDKFRPLPSGTKPSVAITRALATTQDDARQRGFAVDSVKGFIDETVNELPQTMEGYRQLGQHVTSILEQTVVRDADGQLISSVTGAPVKNYGELGRHLLASWDARVTKKLFDPGATALKQEMRQLGKAVIARFGPVIAERLGIKTPKPIKRDTSDDPLILKLLGAARDVPGLLRDLVGEEEL